MNYNHRRFYLNTRTHRLVYVHWWITNGMESGGEARVEDLETGEQSFLEDTEHLQGPISPLEVLARSSL